MDTSNTLFSLNLISESSERYFMDLGNLFPSLLAKETGSSIQTLKETLLQLQESNNNSSGAELSLFVAGDDKYEPLFKQLNSKIETLSKLDKLIAGVKEDSEQMELIALNAMVISIKSGEKGQAFSRITENLQRLSKDMFLFSDKLLEEEKLLITHINDLKSIFTNILEARKDLTTKGSDGSSSINEMISTLMGPLESLQHNIDIVYPPIQKAMEDLQLQDIIRQALEHVKNCLIEMNDPSLLVSGSDEELDAVCFNITLFELAIKVLDDISSNVSDSFLTFDRNWCLVTDNLQSIQSEKDSFVTRFIDEESGCSDNINLRLNTIIKEYRKILDVFGHYHMVQKDLVHTTQSINEKARTMHSVFSNLRPVMSRLHHVRILQQIEVSKNEAIKSVTDSVTDMDNLINSSNKSLDTMEGLLSTFIKETTDLLSKFVSYLEEDNLKMQTLRKNKTAFFDELQDTQKNLSRIISHFEVFPQGFQKKCEKVSRDLSGISEISTNLRQFKAEMSAQIEELKIQKQSLLEQKKIDEWTIKNSKFKDLIAKFTITAHKEAAGEIGGYEIEHGAASGEITFF